MWKLAKYLPFLAFCLFFTKRYFNGQMCSSTARIDGKVVIVTGANTGIGKETATELARRGGKIIMACRSLDRGNQAAIDVVKEAGVAKEKVKVMRLDLASLKSVRQFTEEFKKSESRLDILVNNAGVMFNPHVVTEDGFEETFGVNHLGHFLLTNLLLDRLKASAPSRVVSVSSLGHMSGNITFDDLMFEKREFNKMDAYAQSKLANILFASELAKRQRGTGITAYSVHPGGVWTDLQRHLPLISLPYIGPVMYYPFLYWFCKDLPQGAATSVCCAVDPALASVSGKYYNDCTEAEPWPQALDDEVAKRLWEVSEKLVGLKK